MSSNIALMRKSYIKQLLLLFTTLCFQSLYAQQKDAHTLLWQISGNGLAKPSYLYGTIHIKDKRVFEFNDSLLPDLKKVDAFAMEIALNDSNLQKIGKAAVLDNGKTLKDFFSAKDYQKLTIYLKDKGYDIAMFEHYKPFALISVITMAQMKEDMPQSVDEYLYHQAKADNKQLLSIESVEEQVNALEGLSSKELMEMLVDSTEQQDLEEMVQAYVNADLDKLSEMTDGDGGMDKKTSKKLLIDRNYVMADRIAAMAKQQTTFAAIGAGHLPGDKGVIALLRSKGYAVTPIFARKSQAPPLAETTPSQNDSEKGYLQDDSTFSVQFPSKPEKVEQPASNGLLTISTYTYLLQSKNENQILSATCADYNSVGIDIDNSTANNMLEASLQGVANKFGSTIASEKTLTLNGYPGREITVPVMNNTKLIHMISYLVNGRMYMLQAICDPAKDNNAEMKAFFVSFKLKQ